MPRLVNASMECQGCASHEAVMTAVAEIRCPQWQKTFAEMRPKTTAALLVEKGRRDERERERETEREKLRER